MRTLVFVLLLLTASCFLDDYWAREVSQDAQEEGGRFGSFINQSHGVVHKYFIKSNGSFLVEVNEEDGQARRGMRMMVTALEDLGEDRRAARPAIISCEYSLSQTDQSVKITTKEYLVGNITFLPHNKIVLTSKGVTYQILFSKLNIFLHAFYVILNGLFFIMVSLQFWVLKISYRYNGFQLLNLMLRWFSKIMLFDQYNGWNYYFPDNLKGLYLLVLVLWVLLDFFLFIEEFGSNKNKWDRNISLIIFLMVLLPNGYFYFCTFLVLVYECACVKCQKPMSFDQLVWSYFLYVMLINKVIIFSGIPSILFFTSDKASNLSSILFFLYMGLALFLSHFKVPPHVFFITSLTPYFSCCFAKQCVVCHQYHKNIFFVEQFLFNKGCRIQFRELVSTPCGHAFNKYCLKNHVKGAKNCPIDGLVLSDAWIKKNIGKLGGPNPVLPNKIDIAAGVVNFAEAAQAAENIANIEADGATEDEML